METGTAVASQARENLQHPQSPTGLTEHFQALVQQGWRVCMTDGDYFQKVYILGELFKNIN